MTWRRQLPAWSPVAVGALAAGALASSRDGRHSAALTALLRAEYGAATLQLTESGTAALALAMLASSPNGARPKVAIPAWGCYDLITAADIANAEVVLYDLDPATLAPAEESFAAALAHQPTAVLVVHWFGLPLALTRLDAAVRAAGAVLIEDAAQGVGGTIGGRPLGSLGDFGILSFGRGKGRTGGRGGALLANNGGAASALQRVLSSVEPSSNAKRALVALVAQWAVGRPSLYAIPSSIPSLRLGETIYHSPSPVRAMPEWSAAVVEALWKRSAQESEARRTTAARWSEAIARLPAPGAAAYAESAGSAAGWLRFPVLVSDAATLRDSTARRLGIMRGYEGILADLPLAPGRVVNEGQWPGAVALATRLRTLPTHSLLRAGDMAAIMQLLNQLPASSEPRRS